MTIPPKRITQQQLEAYLWGAAVLLRGTIDAGDYKQFIFPLLFFKRLCDVYDEETETALAESQGDATYAAYPENHRFQVPPTAHWRAVRQVASNVGQALHVAMRAIETANQEKLYGIFDDAQWTNKDRLSDAMLRDLVEHFSTLELRVANLPEDELGQGYEYLIKQFADDSGHTAAEFYTNRTVVHLMTEMLEPQPGEAIYDPTCGSGGMLLSTISHLRRQGKEWRNVRLYGQERNLMTSSIARMNCFLHGIEDFRIERGDTLSEPKFVQGDRLMQFDVVLANPPYSIKQWDRAAFAADPWGRNLYGTPPQGRADYAFWQHILGSLKGGTGRCAILFPHGVLFRDDEAEMRRKLIEADVIEAVIGLGANLFYNSTMPSCIVICRMVKPKERNGKILFINGIDEVTRERSQSFLTDDHIERLITAYRQFKEEPRFSKVASADEISANDYSLRMGFYVPVKNISNDDDHGAGLSLGVSRWTGSRIHVREAIGSVIDGISIQKTSSFKTAPDIAKVVHENFDRTRCTRVQFSDVVRKVADRVVDAPSNGLIHYVAGEHYDSGAVRIQRKGIIEGSTIGPAFYMRFMPGHVLYMSRNPHLRKAGVVDFEGICANTSYVCEAIADKLLPELLPFVMQSDAFWQFGSEHKRGSTNPYLNWPDIAKFEFDLPPLDQQRRIAELLWAVDAVESHYLSLDQVLIELTQAIAIEDFPSLQQSRVRVAELSEVCERLPQSGLYKGPSFVGMGINTVNMGELFGNDVIDRNITMQRMELSSSEVAKYNLTPDDLLFGRRSILLEGAGKCSMVGDLDEPTIFESSILRITVDTTQVSSGYIFAWFNSPEGSREINRIKSFTTVAGISGSALKKVRVPVPPMLRQEMIFDRFIEHRSRIASVRKARKTARLLKSELTEQLVGATS